MLEARDLARRHQELGLVDQAQGFTAIATAEGTPDSVLLEEIRRGDEWYHAQDGPTRETQQTLGLRAYELATNNVGRIVRLSNGAQIEQTQVQSQLDFVLPDGKVVSAFCFAPVAVDQSLVIPSRLALFRQSRGERESKRNLIQTSRWWSDPFAVAININPLDSGKNGFGHVVLHKRFDVDRRDYFSNNSVSVDPDIAQGVQLELRIEGSRILRDLAKVLQAPAPIDEYEQPSHRDIEPM